MTIYSTAFDTTAGSGYIGRLHSLQTALKEADNMQLLGKILVQVNNVGYDIVIKTLRGGHARLDSIAAFNHPVYMANMQGTYNTHLDLRNFGRWDKAQNQFKVTNADELLWNLRRAVLQHLWVNELKATFRDVSILPMKVYANLIAEVVERRYSLNPAEKMRVAIAAAYGYLSFFSDNEEQDFDKVATKIAQGVGAWGRDMIDDVLVDIEPVNNIHELCGVIVKASGSVRLEDFNHGILMSLIAGTWYGTNARENICIGLEHMPTWLMIVWAAVSEATFKRSILAKMVQQYDIKNAGDSMDNAMRMLTGNFGIEKLSEV